MSNYIEVIAIVEGKTEQIFIEQILAPYIGHKKIGMRATQVSKPGQKGGDVRFSRVQRDLGNHLKQRADTYVTTFIDYYGTKKWPGLDLVPSNASPAQIAGTINGGEMSEMVSEMERDGSEMGARWGQIFNLDKRNKNKRDGVKSLILTSEIKTCI